MTAFLANENISKQTVMMLRENGHDVTWVAESFPSIKDDVVLMLAEAERRIIITFDSDYGELIFKRKLKPPLGVIYLRVSSTDAFEPARAILKHLAIAGDIFDRRFCVLSTDRLRYKQL